ncbi:MAG: winged helix-turn-helix domain-containing protein [Dehalococcoidia bacterium]|nr:winged helix-turn-helix domain-containing protein [Dehalococcoidia bacterium]
MILLAASFLFGQGGAMAEDVDRRVDEFADRVVESLTAEEKIGQLVMVSFGGPDAPPDSDISRLILEDKVGAVYLNYFHCNALNGDGGDPSWCQQVGDDPDTPAQVARLANDLQQQAAESFQGEGHDFFLPLLIAVDHDGDGYPTTHLRNRFTPIPCQMAIGATWDEGLSQMVGEVVGRELAAVGVNMLLGPVVDVMAEPKPSPQDRGLRVFGSLPDWVASMGKAYIRGVRTGSLREDVPRVLTVAKHFPGHGASDRSPDLQIGRQGASLAALYEVHLRPFAELAEAHASEEVPDGIMVSHLAYPNIAGCEASPGELEPDPISLNPSCMQAFVRFLDQKSESGHGFSSWQDSHVTIADSLGVHALRNQYGYVGDEQLCWVAQQALMAGNDILTLVEWLDAEDMDRGGLVEWERAHIESTLDCLRQEYEASPDSPFGKRVDEALRRVIRLKLQLYPELLQGDAQFALENTVKVDPQAATDVIRDGQGDELKELARRALTLISAKGGQWKGIPRLWEQHILFVECWDDNYCQRSPELPNGILESTLSQRAARKPPSENLRTRTLTELQTGSDEVKLDVQWADWIVFGVSESAVSWDLHLPWRELARVVAGLYPGLESVQSKSKVIIAYGRPYLADETTVMATDAFLAAYGKIPSAVEASIEGLLGTSRLEGRLPVAFDAAGYPEVVPPITPTAVPTASPIATLTPTPTATPTATLTATPGPQATGSTSNGGGFPWLVVGPSLFGVLAAGGAVGFALYRQGRRRRRLAVKPAPEAELVVDLTTHRVLVKGKEIVPALSREQYELLAHLYENAGKLCRREETVRRVWPDAELAGVSEEALDSLVHRLRDRLQEAGATRQMIVTVRGHGLRLDL